MTQKSSEMTGGRNIIPATTLGHVIAEEARIARVERKAEAKREVERRLALRTFSWQKEG